IPELLRSGRGYEICYALKGLWIYNRRESYYAGNTKWSNRAAVKPTAVYHRFDLEYGSKLWILNDPAEDFKNMSQEVEKCPMEKMSGLVGDQFNCSLRTHLLYAQWSTEVSDDHIEVMEDRIDHLMSDKEYCFNTKYLESAYSDYDDTGNQSRTDFEPIKAIVEATHRAADTFDVNVKSLSKLKAFYLNLVADIRAFPVAGDNGDATKHAISDFAKDLQNYIIQHFNLRDRAKGALHMAELSQMNWATQNELRIKRIGIKVR
ncbi:hypothetical protein QBC38DRAFT_460587, partial [Podospora fimiseda]